MFDILSGLTKAAVNVVTLPISVAADVVTLGGTLNEKDETYTGKRLEDIMDALDEAAGG